MKIDPTIVQIFAENVRAEVIVRPAPVKLDPGIIEKIKQKVPIFNGMTPDCLMRTLSVAEYLPVKAGDVVFNERDIGDSFFENVSGRSTTASPEFTFPSSLPRRRWQSRRLDLRRPIHKLANSQLRQSSSCLLRCP